MTYSWRGEDYGKHLDFERMEMTDTKDTYGKGLDPAPATLMEMKTMYQNERTIYDEGTIYE